MMSPHLSTTSTNHTIATAYKTLVTLYVPGPQSLSYFIPLLLLPLALSLPSSVLPHRWHVCLILPICIASTVHAWIAMGGVDVISVDALLWAAFLLALKDPRREFKRVWRLTGREARGWEGLELVENEGNTVEGRGGEMSKTNGTTNGALEKSDEAPDTRATTINDQDTPRIYLQSHPPTLLSRINWTLNLLASTRLHRWTISSPHHDSYQLRLASRAPPSRTSFVLPLILPLFLDLFVTAPLVVQLFRSDAYFLTALPVDTPFPLPKQELPRTVAMLQTLVPPRLLRMLTLGLYAHHALAIGFLLPCPLVVGMNFLSSSTMPVDTWSPHTLPEYFGSFAHVLNSGLKGLWGRWWHQHMRVMASAPGDWVAEQFGMSGEGRPRWALKVISGFGFSGLTHMGLVPSRIANAMDLRWRIAGFFWMQGLGVLLESGVGMLWSWTRRHTSGDGSSGGRSDGVGEKEGRKEKKGGKSIAMRMLRLAWTLSWLSLTIPLLHDPFRDLGWWKLYPPPEGWVAPWLQRSLDGSWIP